MSYYTLLAQCGLCDQTFASNPQKVPTFPLDRSAAPPMDLHRFKTDASKEPVCKPCFDAINRFREENGLAPHTAMPGAWEDAQEGEL